MIKSNLFKKANPEKANNIVTGAVVGGVAGAGVGALYGAFKAQDEINSVPIETVTLTYKEPTYVSKEIGKVPKDKYVYTKIDNTPTEPVIKEVPVKDENGKVVYKEIVKTFSGHGKPVVSYQTKEVKEPVFLGWDQNVIANAHTHCHTDSDGDKHCTSHVDGYWVRYLPEITYNVIDTYQEPKVKFDHGVNVGKYILNGVLIGGAIGVAVGGIIGAFLYNLYNDGKKNNDLNSDSQEKK
jgi:outer membrane lipoprotein SlyB